MSAERGAIWGGKNRLKVVIEKQFRIKMLHTLPFLTKQGRRMLLFHCQTDPGRTGHELQAWKNLSQKHESSWEGEHWGAG